jgi:multidrug transporter EmrE-like cation transporter
VNLVLSIILTSGLFVVFNYYKIFKVSLIQAICINYMVCLVVGFLFTFTTAPTENMMPSYWAGFAAGLFFLPIFWLMGYTTQTMGLTVAAIANKTSMVIPAMVILWLDPELMAKFTNWKLVAIFLSLSAIILSNLTPQKGNPGFQAKLFIFPLLVFLGGAVVDLAINLATYYTDPVYAAWIPVGAFTAAALSGTTVLLARGIKFDERLTLRSFIGGIALGIPNFFSLYFVVRTLDEFQNDGSTVYPLINTGTILLNTFLSLVLFKEKLNRYLVAGIICAIASICLMSQS